MTTPIGPSQNQPPVQGPHGHGHAKPAPPPAHPGVTHGASSILKGSSIQSMQQPVAEVHKGGGGGHKKVAPEIKPVAGGEKKPKLFATLMKYGAPKTKPSEDLKKVGQEGNVPLENDDKEYQQQEKGNTVLNQEKSDYKTPLFAVGFSLVIVLILLFVITFYS